ncbi:MAG TPA: FKBP-type peptidyl-prolyl cis-trans isomerase [Cytophagaceae bacterium]|jgi:FKBP-type peptidyl-prolyl cis-trans isomerase FkpA|nr:FKBP-type peptidyl-prolyl cis-trans isomerase [Cytophagaceae bacterium]
MRIFIYCLCLLAAGCAKKQVAQKVPVPEFQTTASGLKYKFYKDVPGQNAKLDDVIMMHMILKTSKDSILRSTFQEGKPIQAMVSKPTFKGSLEEAFIMLSPGDSALFLISADSLFEKTIHAPMPPMIEKGSYLKFVLKVEKVYDQEQLKREQQEMVAKQFKADSVLITDYIKANGLAAKRTSSGLYYAQTEKSKGTGISPKTGQTVQVHYTGKLLNGNVFDSSVQRGTPFEFVLGIGQVIKGWDEGIALMKTGEKGRLVIPSALGYGPSGAGASIPPNSVLIFDVELIGVK